MYIASNEWKDGFFSPLQPFYRLFLASTFQVPPRPQNPLKS